MKFTKMQGAGNDFVVVETADAQRDWVKVAAAMCDRHFGIGADSLLVLSPSQKADIKMRIFDADGSEAEACGNGIRCVAKYLFEKGMTKSGARKASIETIAGVRDVRLTVSNGKLIGIQVNMGRPVFGAADIPVVIKPGQCRTAGKEEMLSCRVALNGTDLLLDLVSMGNPHAVFFYERSVQDFPLSELGPKVEHLDIFPKRTNFEVARVVDRNSIELRVWERGCGETMACGSGACAVAVAAQRHGYADNKVDIKVQGGILTVEWNGHGEVLLNGPAEQVFTGEWPD